VRVEHRGGLRPVRRERLLERRQRLPFGLLLAPGFGAREVDDDHALDSFARAEFLDVGVDRLYLLAARGATQARRARIEIRHATSVVSSGPGRNRASNAAAGRAQASTRSVVRIPCWISSCADCESERMHTS